MSTEHSGDGWAVAPDGTRRWGIAGAAGLFLATVSPDNQVEVLLQHRAPWTNQGGVWGIPGGAQNFHESSAEAAVRETVEETGIDASTVDILGELITSELELSHILKRQKLTEEEAKGISAQQRDALEAKDPGLAREEPHWGQKNLVKNSNGQLLWETPEEVSHPWTYTTVVAWTPTELELKPNEESLALEWVPLEEVTSKKLLPAFEEALPDVVQKLSQLNSKLGTHSKINTIEFLREG